MGNKDTEWLAQRFEDQRPELRAVAYRMLGSYAEADDALQDAWERASRAGAVDVGNVGGWLRTIVARVCLNALRTRTTRPEEVAGIAVPDPVVAPATQPLPEDEAVLADSVGVALQVVLDTLTPAERLVFVLHDVFDLPFREIAPMLGRTVQATRQLASRARRRVRDGAAAAPAPARQREVVDAFFAAGRAGNFDALVAILHPDVVLRADFGPGHPGSSAVIRGARAVARAARQGNTPAARVHPVRVDGVPGVVIVVRDRPVVLMAFTVRGGRITAIDSIGDPRRVARLTEPVLGVTEPTFPGGGLVR